MRFIFLVLAIALATYAFFTVYKTSKFNRFSNLSNLLIIIFISFFVALFPLKQPTLDFSQSDNTITITKDGYIRISDIGGQSTEGYLVKVDNGKEYLNILLSDDRDSVPFSGFTFEEVKNITYDLEYDSVDDVFLLYRNFSIASGIQVFVLMGMLLIVFNLILMFARLIREKDQQDQQSRFEINNIQRFINTFERTGMIAFASLFIGYIVLLFVDYPLQYIYYISDNQYLALLIVLTLLPIIVSFIYGMIKQEYALEVGDDSVKVYNGSSLVFESNKDNLQIQETLIRNTRSFGKDYIQMAVNLLDKSNTYQGINIDLKPFGATTSLKLLDKLRAIDLSNDLDPYSDEEILEEDSNKRDSFVLTGRKASKNEQGKILLLVFGAIVAFFAIIFLSALFAEKFGSVIASIAIILLGLTPVLLVIIYQINMNRNMGILNVNISGNTITLNEETFEINEHLALELPYPDSVSARIAKIKISSYGNVSTYLIRRNHKIPKDGYYELYSILSQSYPKNLKVK